MASSSREGEREMQHKLTREREREREVSNGSSQSRLDAPISSERIASTLSMARNYLARLY